MTDESEWRIVNYAMALGKIVDITPDGNRTLQWIGGARDRERDVITADNLLHTISVMPQGQHFKADILVNQHTLNGKIVESNLFRINTALAIDPPKEYNHEQRKGWWSSLTKVSDLDKNDNLPPLRGR